MAASSITADPASYAVAQAPTLLCKQFLDLSDYFGRLNHDFFGDALQFFAAQRRNFDAQLFGFSNQFGIFS